MCEREGNTSVAFEFASFSGANTLLALTLYRVDVWPVVNALAVELVIGPILFSFLGVFKSDGHWPSASLCNYFDARCRVDFFPETWRREYKRYAGLAMNDRMSFLHSFARKRCMKLTANIKSYMSSVAVQHLACKPYTV